MDRIDIHTDMRRVPFEGLEGGESSAAIWAPAPITASSNSAAPSPISRGEEKIEVVHLAEAIQYRPRGLCEIGVCDECY
jgi:hypothetical protein